MGNSCTKNVSTKNYNADIQNIDQELIAKAKKNSNIIIIGPSSVGKTLFWTRLVFANINVDELMATLTPTDAFNVMNISIGGKIIYIWDLAGDPLIQSMTFKGLVYLKVKFIFYMINLSISQAECKKVHSELSQLLSDILLLSSNIVLLVNIRHDINVEDNKLNPETEQRLYDILLEINITHFETKFKERFSWLISDVSKGLLDAELNYFFNNIKI